MDFHTFDALCTPEPLSPAIPPYYRYHPLLLASPMNPSVAHPEMVDPLSPTQGRFVYHPGFTIPSLDIATPRVQPMSLPQSPMWQDYTFKVSEVSDVPDVSAIRSPTSLSPTASTSTISPGLLPGWAPSPSPHMSPATLQSPLVARWHSDQNITADLDLGLEPTFNVHMRASPGYIREITTPPPTPEDEEAFTPVSMQAKREPISPLCPAPQNIAPPGAFMGIDVTSPVTRLPSPAPPTALTAYNSDIDIVDDDESNADNGGDGDCNPLRSPISPCVARTRTRNSIRPAVTMRVPPVRSAAARPATRATPRTAARAGERRMSQNRSAQRKYREKNKHLADLRASFNLATLVAVRKLAEGKLTAAQVTQSLAKAGYLFVKEVKETCATTGATLEEELQHAVGA